MITPIDVRGRGLDGRGLRGLCSAQIRKIAYIAPQNTDVDFGIQVAVGLRAGLRVSCG
jgi:hypothetical protein